MAKMKKLMCMTEPQLQKLIEKTAKQEGMSHAELANKHDVLPQRISAFLRNVEPAGNQIPAMFDLAPIVVFVPKDSELYEQRIKSQRAAPKPVHRKSNKTKEKNKKKDKRRRVA